MSQSLVSGSSPEGVLGFPRSSRNWEQQGTELSPRGNKLSLHEGVGTVEVEQAPAFGKQICYSLKKDLNLGLGGCVRKWLVQPGQAESEKTSHGDSKWRWNEVITEGQPGILGGTGGEVGK